GRFDGLEAPGRVSFPDERVDRVGRAGEPRGDIGPDDRLQGPEIRLLATVGSGAENEETCHPAQGSAHVRRLLVFGWFSVSPIIAPVRGADKDASRSRGFVIEVGRRQGPAAREFGERTAWPLTGPVAPASLGGPATSDLK